VKYAQQLPADVDAIPVQQGDTIVYDDTEVTVTGFTDTGLINTDSGQQGLGEFKRELLDANRVVVTRE
jgi:hypothetical protein